MVFPEALAEYLVDGLSDALTAAETPAPPIALAVDRYLALSAPQKAIRRGEEDLALRAAMTLRIEGPNAIWRRLGIVAFEDVGVANIDLVGWVTVVIGDRELRTRLGGEWRVIHFLRENAARTWLNELARSLRCQEAPKVRSRRAHRMSVLSARPDTRGRPGGGQDDLGRKAVAGI